MIKMIIDIYPPVAKPRPRVREVSLVWRGGRSLAAVLFVVLSAVAINAVGTTVAYYFDSETSRDNFFAAASLDFTVATEKPDNRFKTFTQGGWGVIAHGDNPGAYRNANFASAFPTGAVIGQPDGYTALFTDARAVRAFLPAFSTPGPFTESHIDPRRTEAGVLAGQVLALTLNVGFDLADSNFAPSVNNLKDYIIRGSTVLCDGMTVQEVLDEANTILGGLTSSFSPSEINECATWINERFTDGGADGLAPGGSITQFATISNGGSLDFQYTVKVEKTGGDDNFCQALNLEAGLEGVTSYTGKLIDFVSLPVLYSTSTDEWKLIISLPIDAEVKGSCSFDFLFSGWQTTLPEFFGFSDIERIDDPVYSVVHRVAFVTMESEDDNESENMMLEIVENLATTTELFVATSADPLISVEAITTESLVATSPDVITEATTTEIKIIEATTTTLVIEEAITADVVTEEVTATEPESTPTSETLEPPLAVESAAD